MLLLPTLFTATTGQSAALPAAIAQIAAVPIFGSVVIVLGFVTWRAWRRDQERSDDALAHERSRADRAELANATLNKEVIDRVVPALTEVNRAMVDVLQALRDLDRR